MEPKPRKVWWCCWWAIGLMIPARVSCQTPAQRIGELMDRLHEAGRFNGALLVAARGEAIYQGAFGYADFGWRIPNRVDTRFRIGSLTKAFTSALIMQLVEEGRLRLEDRITDCLPDYPAAQGDRVTVHHLLCHRSGIPNYFKDIPGFWHRSNIALHVQHAPHDLLNLFSALDLKFEPGAQFDYCNSNYCILGAIIERVTGKPLRRALRERILDPLGMSDTDYVPDPRVIVPRLARGYYQTPAGYENADADNPSLYYAAGGLFSTVGDLYRWDRALYTDRVVSRPSRELLFKPHLLNPETGGGYGYGWDIGTVQMEGAADRIRYLGHAGDALGYFAWIGRFVDEGDLIVFLTNTNAIHVGNMEEVFGPIVRILRDRPHAVPEQPSSGAHGVKG